MPCTHAHFRCSARVNTSMAQRGAATSHRMTFASGVAVGVAAAAAGVWLWGLWRGGRRLPALRKRPKGEYVVISRPAEFAEKKKRMVLDGVHTLQVISDFDFTLTRFMRNGARLRAVCRACARSSPAIARRRPSGEHASRD